MADDKRALVELYLFLQRRLDGLDTSYTEDCDDAQRKIDALWRNIINYK